MTSTRRQFLASGAAVAAGLGTLTGTAAAEPDDYDVAVDYPEDWLQRYRPAFVTSREASQKVDGLYAHRARHDDREHDIAAYWLRKTHQDGLPLLGADAHLYDHEPAHVYVDDDGHVDRVIYTAYHHFAETISGEALQQALRSRETDDETHIQLRVIEPWHNYAPAFSPDDSEVVFYDSEGDGDASHLRTWETRGIFDSTADEAVWDPWTVEERGSWWDESTWDYRVASLWHTVGQHIDIGGSGETIQEEHEP